MPDRKRDDTNGVDDFEKKVGELDFDVWGTGEEDDGSSRRRDPLRTRPPRKNREEDELDLF